MTDRELLDLAIDARRYSYAPYSEYHVGAALLTKSGKVYKGCNIENASFGATNCAERTAIFKAVSEGEGDFEAIAIVGGKDGKELELCPPCGICRQVMTEFCDLDTFRIVLGDENTEKSYTLTELLPLTFEGMNK